MNGLAAAVREVRTKRGIRQDDIARLAHVHRTYISHVENGRIPDNPEVLRTLAKSLDCAWLHKALHEALASCVFVHRKLNGGSVDLHRSSVKAKTLEELEEAIDALRGFDAVNKPGDVTDEQREQLIEGLMMQLLGAENAIETLVSVVCEEYGISVSEVYERFNERMQAKGYQQRPEGA